MKNKNIVFIAASIDGYIADRNGGLEWLQSIPNPDNIDMGYSKLMSEVDALIMGRSTFETICSFDCEWPYSVPVFVLSRTLNSIPEGYGDKAELLKGTLEQILDKVNGKGYKRLYIDGGVTIQNFLNEDLIDDLIITTIPVLLGGGTPLFSELTEEQQFTLVESKVFLNEIVQSHFKRKR